MRIFALCFLLISQYSSANFDWSDYTTLLSHNVVNAEKSGIKTNLINYQAFGDSAQFTQLVEKLATFDPTPLKGKEKLAFYINAYNALAIKLIIDHEPKKSIRDIGTWFSPVWQKPAGVINGKAISLDTIEHKILRTLDEPRIHFAIVCASLSCPDLRTEAYSAATLELQLEEQTRAFLNNRQKGVDIKGQKISISKIFDWFSVDFSGDKGEQGILNFISKYNIEAGRFSSYSTLDYNWKLNKQ